MSKLGVLVFLVLGIAVSLHMAYVQAAISLPPEAEPLERHFYKKLNTCANVEPFVKHQVKIHWEKDKSLTAKLVKLLYADCLVNGCDASILLDGPNTEKTAPQNAGLAAYVLTDVFVLIDKIKKVLEIRCPRAVSCADILNIATRDALNFSGAPSYPVFLGRRDGVESKASWVDLPSPSISWESGLAYFKSKGLDVQDFATLLGAHTMGRTHCSYIQDRLYNFNNTGKRDPSMNRDLVNTLRKQCPKKSKSDSLVYLNPENGPEYKFTNTYYSRVLAKKSVLGIDQQLLFGNDTKEMVDEYTKEFELFRREFAFTISRMGSLKVLTGKKGEIRLNCRVPNKH